MPQQRTSPRAQLDATTPNVARMYDYYLGGKDNYAADRAAADKLLAVVPEVRWTTRENRKLLGRMVRFLAERGIRQFIDVGTGLPTQASVHQVAHQVAPDARVVYVDNDPVVLTHARALLADSDKVTVIDGDVRRPDLLLADGKLTKLVDLDQPVAILLLFMLHLIGDDDEPHAIVSALKDAMVPGSYLAISCATSDNVTREQAAITDEVYRHATSTVTLRSMEEILRFFDGLDLLEPGLVRGHYWRPERDTASELTGEQASTGVVHLPDWGPVAGLARVP